MTATAFFRVPVLLTILSAAMPALAQVPAASTPGEIMPGAVVITGAVPDEATKSQLIARLNEVYGVGHVVDKLTVGGVSSPPNWGSLVPKLVGKHLRSIAKGQIAVDGTAVSLRGEVGNEMLRQSIAADIASSLDPSYVINNGLRVNAAGQAAIDLALADRTIEFEPGSAMLTDAGKHVLDELVVVLKNLDAKRFEIIGHTDNIGDARHNLSLSRSRAESVKTYLVKNGVRAELVATSGMGADQPLMSNDTAEGRRRNRRIEFRASQ